MSRQNPKGQGRWGFDFDFHRNNKKNLENLVLKIVSLFFMRVETMLWEMIKWTSWMRPFSRACKFLLCFRQILTEVPSLIFAHPKV